LDTMKPEGLRNFFRSNKNIAFSLAMILFLVFQFFVRFEAAKSNGIRGTDTFQYYEIIKLWSEGQYIFNDISGETFQFFRPYFYFLGSLYFKLFNGADYSIKVLSITFETLVLGLMFLVGYKITRSKLCSLAMMAVYSASPMSIFNANTEMPHTTSTFFVLLAGYFLLKAVDFCERKMSSRWLFFSGLSAGAAALFHGSLTFIGPAFILALLIVEWQFGWSRVIHFAKKALFFSIGFFLNYFISFTLLGWSRSLSALLSEGQTNSGMHNKFKLVASYLYYGPLDLFSQTFAVLFLVGVLFFAGARLRELWLKRTIQLDNWLLLPSIYLFYAAIFSLFLPTVFHTRILHPFMPFQIILVFALLYQVLNRLRADRWKHLFFPFFALGFVYLQVMPSKAQMTRILSGKEYGNVKPIFSLIGNKVSNDTKLLVTPSAIRTSRKFFQSSAYFAQNAVYLFDCPQGETLQSFIQSHRVRFVLIAPEYQYDLKTIESFKSLSTHHLGSCSGLTHSEYTFEKEIQHLKAFLASVGAEQILSSEDFGQLYEIK
jgi:hypothetical protein